MQVPSTPWAGRRARAVVTGWRTTPPGEVSARADMQDAGRGSKLLPRASSRVPGARVPQARPQLRSRSQILQQRCCTVRNGPPSLGRSSSGDKASTPPPTLLLLRRARPYSTLQELPLMLPASSQGSGCISFLGAETLAALVALPELGRRRGCPVAPASWDSRCQPPAPPTAPHACNRTLSHSHLGPPPPLGLWLILPSLSCCSALLFSPLADARDVRLAGLGGEGGAGTGGLCGRGGSGVLKWSLGGAGGGKGKY